jgi:uncharacterized protein with gpF-like domain
LSKPDNKVKPGPVPEDVIKYFGSKGLVPSYSYLDVWNQQHTFAFTFAKATRVDLVAAVQDSLAEAIAEGIPYEEWRKRLKPTLEAMGWWHPYVARDPLTGQRTRVNPPTRLARIYDTNMRSARAAAQWDRIQRQASTRPYLMWVVGPSQKHREQHLAWHGLTLPANHPFWREVGIGPLGWGCKCGVRSVSRTEYEDLQANGVKVPNPEPILDEDGNPTGHTTTERRPIITTPPQLTPKVWTNSRTGQTITGWKEVDPNFQGNPGEARRKAYEEAKRRSGL